MRVKKRRKRMGPAKNKKGCWKLTPKRHSAGLRKRREEFVCEEPPCPI